MRPKQRRFAEEYTVDHNGKQAAIRAGYSPARAEVTASELLRNPDVVSLVSRLDGEKRERLQLDADAEVLKLIEIRDLMIEEIKKPWSAVVKAQELLLRVAGVLEQRQVVEHSGEVRYVHQLDLGRQLEAIEAEVVE